MDGGLATLLIAIVVLLDSVALVSIVPVTNATE